MAKNLPEIQDHNIVLIGDFNPKIFQPAWFAMVGLLRKEEAESAEIQIIHPDVVSFNISWFTLNITRDRFNIGTTQESYYEPLRDLVSGTFEILIHTPLRMMGINFNRHYRMDSADEWHALGHELAPKERWGKVMTEPGMRSLTIEESKRPDGFKGYLRVVVEPSVKIHPGVYFQTNDHLEVSSPDSIRGGEEIITILRKVWHNSKDRSYQITNTILGI